MKEYEENGIGIYQIKDLTEEDVGQPCFFINATFKGNCDVCKKEGVFFIRPEGL